MCGYADRTIIVVTTIIVMMKGYYKNTGQQEKQGQTYKPLTTFFAQHVFPRIKAFLRETIFIILFKNRVSTSLQ
jgi:hypothetical protein